jgi:hypothetical protein
VTDGWPPGASPWWNPGNPDSPDRAVPAATTRLPDLETALYAPVKRFLEGLGYCVKGEIGGADLVGVRDDGRLVVIGELKLRFSLDLLLQAVDRMAACDEVWMAIRARPVRAEVRKLCRLLGFGLLTVDLAGRVEAVVPAGPYRPRANPKRRGKYLQEHRRRQGDPAQGGSTRAPIMTAYRQRSLACAAALRDSPARPRDLKPAIEDAPALLLRNVYGWFVRLERGLYGLSEEGRAALLQWPQEIIQPIG